MTHTPINEFEIIDKAKERGLDLNIFKNILKSYTEELMERIIYNVEHCYEVNEDTVQKIILNALVNSSIYTDNIKAIE